VALHRGRIVKTTGDGILIEFPSVVVAVRCALDVQCGMDGRNADVPAEQRIEFRVRRCRGRRVGCPEIARKRK